MRTRSPRPMIALLFTLLLAGAASAQSFDPGTGLGASSAPGTPGALKRQVVCLSTVGYTTDNVIAHYSTLDNPARSSARADLVAQGHTLVPVDALTTAALSGLDVLVVGVVRDGAALSPAQVDAIEAFVRSGHKLVFLGENNNYFRDNNVAVGGRFGITYPTTDPAQTVLTAASAHPIMLGPFGLVSTVDGSNNSTTYYGSMSSPGPYGASILSFTDGSSACVVIEPGALAPGSGQVVAVAEINIWDNGQFSLADNRAFWNNIFAYCPIPTAVKTSSWGRIKSMYR